MWHIGNTTVREIVFNAEIYCCESDTMSTALSWTDPLTEDAETMDELIPVHVSHNLISTLSGCPTLI
jgi:hypothetical protein